MDDSGDAWFDEIWAGEGRERLSESPSAQAVLLQMESEESVVAAFISPGASLGDAEFEVWEEIYGGQKRRSGWRSGRPSERRYALHVLTPGRLHIFTDQIWNVEIEPIISFDLKIDEVKVEEDEFGTMRISDVLIGGTVAEVRELHEVIERHHEIVRQRRQWEANRSYYEEMERRRLADEERRAAELERRRHRPADMPIRTPRDAERVAEAWLRFWGFPDAEMTPVGADEGIDVIAGGAVAQVKAQAVQIGRPDIQGLFGAAAHLGKKAFFFSLGGYTAQAVDWANKAGVALFEFDLLGSPKPVNPLAMDYAT